MIPRDAQVDPGGGQMWMHDYLSRNDSVLNRSENGCANDREPLIAND